MHSVTDLKLHKINIQSCEKSFTEQSALDINIAHGIYFELAPKMLRISYNYKTMHKMHMVISTKWITYDYTIMVKLDVCMFRCLYTNSQNK